MMKKILPSILLIGAIFTCSNVFAQLNYTVTYPTTTYTAITGTKPTLSLAYPPTQAAAEGVPSSDEGAANNITIPFSFNFNGINYTKCHISTNGFMALGSQILDTFNVYWGNNLTSGPYNGTGNNSRGSRPIIAPLWDDLDANSSTAWISYTTSGATPNRVFTVQWNNAKWGWQATGPNMSFQVKLYETTNVIDFVYKQGTTATLASPSASIGLSDVFTGSGNFLSQSGVTGTATSSSTTETTTISTRPANNFTIRYTPIAIPTQDAGIRIYTAPVVSTCLTDPQTARYIIKNAGTGNIAAGAATVNLTITGANSGTYSVSNSKAINFNEFDTVTITGINLNNSGSSLLTAVVSTASDGRVTNDSSRYTYRTASTISSFPAYEDSKTAAVFPYTIAFFGSNLWTKFNNPSLTVPNNANPLVPIIDAGDTTFYCFLARYSGLNSFGYSGLLYSQCLNIPSGQPAANYNLAFYMTQDSAINTTAAFTSDDSLFVNISTDTGRTWNRIAGFNRLDFALPGFTWVKQTVALDAYAGKTIQIGFEGTSAMGNLIGLDSITINANYPLPIKLTSFTGTREAKRNILHWTTTNETNNKGFELQRSSNGRNYEAISFINSKATNGNSSATLNYSYTDENPVANVTNYYRLRQVDINGKESISEVVALKSATIVKAEIIKMYPNPVSERLNVVINTPNKEVVSIKVTDLAGRTILQQNVSTVSGDNNIQFATTALTSGTYIVKVMNVNTEIATQKFVKQ